MIIITLLVGPAAFAEAPLLILDSRIKIFLTLFIFASFSALFFFLLRLLISLFWLFRDLLLSSHVNVLFLPAASALASSFLGLACWAKFIS
jgi:hypothetical protein